MLRIAAELARQIAHGPGAAERHPQQQPRALAEAGELAHFIRIVGDKGAHAEFQGVADVLGALDRMGVDAALGTGAQPLHQLHFAGGGQVQIAARLHHHLHHGGMRQRLERIVQIDIRQRLLQLAQLHANPFAVNDQQR